MDTAERPPQPVAKPIETHPVIPATGVGVPDAAGLPPGAPGTKTAKEQAFLLPSYLDSFQGEPETKEFLGNLLDTNFNHLDRFLDADSASDKHIATQFGLGLSELMNRVVAEEFQNLQTYVPPAEAGGNCTLVADKVLMLKRSAFIHDLMVKGGYGEKEPGMFVRPPSFIFLDIKDLYSANMAGAADWMLSKVAKQINDTARAYFEKNGIGNSYATCRYGGDEFVVGTIGLTPQQNQELQQLLSNGMEEIQGYFLDPAAGQVQQRPIQLNQEKSAVLTVPLHPVDREIFTTYLHRGLILDREQVSRVRQMYSAEDVVFDKDRFRSVSARDDAMRSTDEKVTAILFGDPDLSFIMTMTDYLDRREERKATSTGEAEASTVITREGGSTREGAQGKRKKNLVDLLEGVVYDALLGENVVSIEGLQTQIQKGNITKMACVDLKFVKEINDASSYAEGDMAIETLWNSLALHLTPIERRSLVIARRGGTFILGQRKNGSEVLGGSRLEEIMDELTVNVKGNRVDVPLGVRHQALSLPASVSRADAGRVIGQIIQATEGNWYGKVADEIRNDASLSAAFEKLHACMAGKNTTAVAVAEVAKGLSPGMRGAPDKNGLILSFFFGKPGLRTDMRVSRIMSELYPPEPVAQETPGTVQ